ncbi:uncharacterized protein TrAtP1_009260 [Trichoderma atroviride]|uniref:DUF7702 domain-containing protein n=1 Tax=Hypocrea atroviridis (strain ATCC 20476 / IMI 206040) TaxID=452589 RepID=G9NEI9_HYPAI|nr:uncharacterized protein TRIATDRAFT_83807 [Trichoderma atroviride IMI 206040]EHK50887.1 hypothetical protein TRIATDRAFT_83807 [Trichoderma atroviride IMI 206040]UKZ68225.1 hypothetical protein TrAtP1_009260 [Trichoderma atroviride]
MAHVTLSDGLAIWQLVYYVVTLICSIFVSFRHGLARSSGWIFLTIFSIIRVVGCSAQIATITATSDTAETIATILGFLGLSPLLLATLGILTRVYYYLLERPYNTVFNLFVAKIVQIPAVVALILCIVGATSADTAADIMTQDTVKDGVIVYLVVLILLILLTIGAYITRHVTERRGERTMLLIITLSLPFLLVRIINSLLLIFDKHFQDSTAEGSTSSVLTELFMARIEEMIVVLFYLYAGLTHKAVPEGDHGKRTNKEKIAHRAARGDFGDGRLGVISLAIATAGASFKRENDKPSQNDQDAEIGLVQYRTTR